MLSALEMAFIQYLECYISAIIIYLLSQDNHLQQLKKYIRLWQENKDKIPQDIQTYCTFSDDMAVIDEIILKDRHVVIPAIFQKQPLYQLHINHMGMEKETPGT